jgi:hypothetical protein
MRFGHWREAAVQVSIGASAVALAFAAIDATAEPILSALALLGVALMLARDIGPGPLRSIAEPESPPREPWTRVHVDVDDALVDATSA